ncbi:MAG: NfeD family protein [Rhabdochlamydiaceae bacterium]|nr:NfeD family protein [Candidatus Amphrikana amoebophyrae]
MFWLTIGLLLISLLLIYLEFYLPGGIPGTFGAILLLGSVFTFYTEFQSIQWSIAYFISALLFSAMTCLFAIRNIKRSGVHNTMYLAADQKGYMASSYNKEVVGLKGEAITSLRLSGHIEIEGRQYQAMSKNQFIEKGEKVIVIGGQGSYLLVKVYKD